MWITHPRTLGLLSIFYKAVQILITSPSLPETSRLKVPDMLLLPVMMILQVFSAQGGVVQEYPYFSQDVSTGTISSNRPMQYINRPRINKHLFFTFDPAAVRELNEYIWIDHK